MKRGVGESVAAATIPIVDVAWTMSKEAMLRTRKIESDPWSESQHLAVLNLHVLLRNSGRRTFPRNTKPDLTAGLLADALMLVKSYKADDVFTTKPSNGLKISFARLT